MATESYDEELVGEDWNLRRNKGKGELSDEPLDPVSSMQKFQKDKMDRVDPIMPDRTIPDKKFW